MAFSFSSTSGSSGVTSITVSATSRQELTDLVEDFTLSNQTKSMAMPIAQRAYQPSEKYIIFSPVTMSIGSSGGTASLNVRSNDNWVIVADDWIQLSRFMDIDRGPQTISGDGNTIIGIRLFENLGEARTGTISGYCVSDSSITASTVVSQAGSYVKPYIVLGSYSADVQYNASSYTFSVSSNTSWNVTTDARWVTLNTLSGTGNSNVSYSVLANSGEHRRTATITVFNADEGITANFTLVQEAEQEYPYIKVEPNSFNVSWSGTSGNVISVSANCDYDITTDVAWITTNAASGSGDGSVSFTTLPNSGSSDVGNIVLANSAVSKVVTVQRQAVGKYLSASTNYISSSSTGGTFEVSVYSNVNWSVSVDMGEGRIDTPWLSATPVSGSNDGTVRISVADTLARRTGSVVLTNSNYGLSWVISVLQKGKGNVIYYTSNNGSVINVPTTGWGANVVSNTYNDGVGVIAFDGDVTTIPSNAFGSSVFGNRLTSVVLPDTVDYLKYHCIMGEELSSITLSNISNIELNPILASYSLKEVHFNGTISEYINTWGTILNHITAIDYLQIFDNNGYDLYLNDTLVTYVDLSDYQGDMNDRAFCMCNSVTGVTIGENVDTIIGFYSATSLSYVQCNAISGSTPYAMTENGVWPSFSGCPITRVDVGSDVVSLPVGLFYTGGNDLVEINSYAMTAPILYKYDPRWGSMFTGPSPFASAAQTGTLHYPIGSDYSTWISDLPSGWTAVADL